MELVENKYSQPYTIFSTEQSIINKKNLNIKTKNAGELKNEIINNFLLQSCFLTSTEDN